MASCLPDASVAALSLLSVKIVWTAARRLPENWACAPSPQYASPSPQKPNCEQHRPDEQQATPAPHWSLSPWFSNPIVSQMSSESMTDGSTVAVSL